MLFNYAILFKNRKFNKTLQNLRFNFQSDRNFALYDSAKITALSLYDLNIILINKIFRIDFSHCRQVIQQLQLIGEVILLKKNKLVLDCLFTRRGIRIGLRCFNTRMVGYTYYWNAIIRSIYCSTSP